MEEIHGSRISPRTSVFLLPRLVFGASRAQNQFKRLDKSSLKPANKAYGHSYSSFVLHAPKYLAHLAALCAERSIPIIRQRLSSLDEAYDHPSIGSIDLVINATGLGARWLPGVEDGKVYPAKGQTVLVRAPGVKTCYMSVEGGFNVAPGQAGDCEPSPICSNDPDPLTWCGSDRRT